METEILKRVWQISGTKSHHVLQVYQSFDKAQQKVVASSLNSLIEREFIQIRGSHMNFNINKLPLIKNELKVS